jgi:hypothetical protein
MALQEARARVNRERALAEAARARCGVCHRLVRPLGLGWRWWYRRRVRVCDACHAEAMTG